MTSAVSHVDDEVMTRLRALPAAVVGDVQERLNVVHSSISTMWSGAAFVGPAHTVLTTAGDNRALHEALESVRPGDVIVVNGQGDMSRALLGELIAEKARARGVVGFLVDGCVRDVAQLSSIPMPVFARGATPAGPFKNGPGVVGRPVAIGGVVVAPGHIVVADDDGVVIVEPGRLAEIVASAERKAELEESIRARLRRGDQIALY